MTNKDKVFENFIEYFPAQAEASDSSFCSPSSNGNSFASFGYPNIGGGGVGGEGAVGQQQGCGVAKEEAAVAVGNKA